MKIVEWSDSDEDFTTRKFDVILEHWDVGNELKNRMWFAFWKSLLNGMEENIVTRFKDIMKGTQE